MLNTSKQLKALVRKMSGRNNAKSQIIVRNYRLGFRGSRAKSKYDSIVEKLSKKI